MILLIFKYCIQVNNRLRNGSRLDGKEDDTNSENDDSREDSFEDRKSWKRNDSPAGIMIMSTFLIFFYIMFY